MNARTAQNNGRITTIAEKAKENFTNLFREIDGHIIRGYQFIANVNRDPTGKLEQLISLHFKFTNQAEIPLLFTKIKFEFNRLTWKDQSGLNVFCRYIEEAKAEIISLLNQRRPLCETYDEPVPIIPLFDLNEVPFLTHRRQNAPSNPSPIPNATTPTAMKPNIQISKEIPHYEPLKVHPPISWEIPHHTHATKKLPMDPIHYTSSQFTPSHAEVRDKSREDSNDNTGNKSEVESEKNESEDESEKNEYEKNESEQNESEKNEFEKNESEKDESEDESEKNETANDCLTLSNVNLEYEDSDSKDETYIPSTIVGSNYYTPISGSGNISSGNDSDNAILPKSTPSTPCDDVMRASNEQIINKESAMRHIGSVLCAYFGSPKRKHRWPFKDKLCSKSLLLSKKGTTYVVDLDFCTSRGIENWGNDSRLSHNEELCPLKAMCRMEKYQSRKNKLQHSDMWII